MCKNNYNFIRCKNTTTNNNNNNMSIFDDK